MTKDLLIFAGDVVTIFQSYPILKLLHLERLNLPRDRLYKLVVQSVALTQRDSVVLAINLLELAGTLPIFLLPAPRYGSDVSYPLTLAQLA